MKKVLFLIMSAFFALSANAQFDIKYRENDNYYLIKYGLDTTHVIPKGTTYAKLQYGNEVGLFYNSGQPIVNYVSHFLYNINGASVATPNALMDSLSLILGMPLDSVGGGGIVGVEHINGKDGDLKIVAGSNVIIDNSKSDTIIINATGGNITVGNGLNAISGYNVSLGGNLNQHTTINTNDYDYIISNNNVSFETSEHSAILRFDTSNYIGVVNNGALKGIVLKSPQSDIDNVDYVLCLDSTNNGVPLVKKVPKSDFISDTGAYLPLDISDSTTVELNGNSVMFKGDNHSLVMNTPFEALEIAEAVMDGFRAQQYDDILTMNGLMKVPLGFGDTIRYPVMFVSHGMPFSDTARFASIRGSLGNELGFIISTSDEAAEDYVTYGFFNDKLSIIKNAQSVFEIDLATGIIDAPYVGSKDSTNIAQVKDIIDLTAPSIVTIDTSIYYIVDGGSYIVTLVDGSEFVYLPAPSLSIGKSIYIINDSSNGVDIYSGIANTLWSNGSLSSSISIPSGSTMKLISNGSYWAIF